MNSARERGALRIRQATAALVGASLAATGSAVVLAHESQAGTTASTSSAGSRATGSTSSDSSSSSQWQLGVGGGAPQAQSGGS